MYWRRSTTMMTETPSYYASVNNVMALLTMHTATETTPTVKELLGAHASDSACQTAPRAEDSCALLFTCDHDGVSVREALVHGALQKYVSATLCPSILYFSFYSTLGGHTREPCIYGTMRDRVFWSYKEFDLHRTPRNSLSCSQDRSQMKRNHKVQLFPAFGQLELAAINILGQLPETSFG